MEKYIPLDALVAEINRLIAELAEKGENTMFEQGRISAFEDAKLFLDNLEVKEVDLDKPFEGIKVQTSMESGSLDEVIVTTKYKAQKGEKAC